MTTFVQTFEFDDVRVIELESRYLPLDTAVFIRLRNSLTAIFEQEPTTPLVVVDMNRAEYFTSELVGWMIQARRKVIDAGGRFCVCCPQPFANEVLRVLQFERICQVFDSREEAVVAIRKGVMQD